MRDTTAMSPTKIVVEMVERSMGDIDQLTFMSVDDDLSMTTYLRRAKAILCDPARAMHNSKADLSLVELRLRPLEPLLHQRTFLTLGRKRRLLT